MQYRGDPVSPATGDVQRLRAQLDRMQGRSLDAPVLPVHPLAHCSRGGLRPGAAYDRLVDLAPVALPAAPSQSGSWCGVVGMPRLGAEAAEGLGVDLAARPDPRPRYPVARGDGDHRRGAARRRRASLRPGDRRRGVAPGRAAARSRCGAARAGAVAAGRGGARGRRSGVDGARPRSRLSRRRGHRHVVEPPLARAAARARAVRRGMRWRRGSPAVSPTCRRGRWAEMLAVSSTQCSGAASCCGSRTGRSRR